MARFLTRLRLVVLVAALAVAEVVVVCVVGLVALEYLGGEGLSWLGF